jgi:hypothetical protein
MRVGVVKGGRVGVLQQVMENVEAKVANTNPPTTLGAKLRARKRPETVGEASKKAQSALLGLVTSIATADKGFAKIRFWFVAVLAAGTVGGTVGLVWSVANKDKWAAAASAVAVVAGLVTAGFVNPLQTIERDIIIRRWSDVITAGWADQAGKDPKVATSDAIDGFIKLAAAYAVMTGQTIDALTAIGTKPATSDSAADDKPLAIAPIGVQNNSAGETLKDKIKVEASGGSGTYKFSMAGEPEGATQNPSSGEISGTISDAAEAKDYVVDITVENSEPATAAVDDTERAATSASQSFVWKITKPKAALAVGAVPAQSSRRGEAPTLTITASGGSETYTYGWTNAPTGLELDADSGVVSGTIASDAAVGTQDVTITVKDKAPEAGEETVEATSTFKWTVAEAT